MTKPPDRRSRLWFIDVAGLALIVGLSAVALSFIVKPLALERDQLAAARADLDDARQQADTVERRESDLRGELDRLRTALDASPVQLEPSDRLNHRLARIVDLATTSELVINETRSDRARPGPRYDTVPVALSGFGDYQDCVVFLRTLARTLPDVEVIGLDLSNSPATPGSSPMFAFDLAWYAAASGEDGP